MTASRKRPANSRYIHTKGHGFAGSALWPPSPRRASCRVSWTSPCRVSCLLGSLPGEESRPLGIQSSPHPDGVRSGRPSQAGKACQRDPAYSKSTGSQCSKLTGRLVYKGTKEGFVSHCDAENPVTSSDCVPAPDSCQGARACSHFLERGWAPTRPCHPGQPQGNRGYHQVAHMTPQATTRPTSKASIQTGNPARCPKPRLAQGAKAPVVNDQPL